MTRRHRRGFLAGLLASSVLVAASLGAREAGLLPEAPFWSTYRSLLEPLPVSGAAALAIAALLSIVTGAVWGHIYEALVRRSTPLTGALFGVVPTLWLWLVTFPMTGKPVLGDMTPATLLVPLGLNCLLWGPLLGFLARPVRVPRPAQLFS